MEVSPPGRCGLIGLFGLNAYRPVFGPLEFSGNSNGGAAFELAPLLFGSAALIHLGRDTCQCRVTKPNTAEHRGVDSEYRHVIGALSFAGLGGNGR